MEYKETSEEPDDLSRGQNIVSVLESIVNSIFCPVVVK